jgi:hypothetical protein
MLFLSVCVVCALALAAVLAAAPWRRSRDRVGDATPTRQTEGAPARPASPRSPGQVGAGRVVVAVAALQAVASLCAAGWGALYALEAASPGNRGEFADLGVAIGGVVVALGLAGAAAYAALAVGLRRRYRQVRHVFAAAQAVLTLGVVNTHEPWSWPAAAVLVATVVLCYLGDVENPRPAPSQEVGAPATGRDEERGDPA